jgi:putative tricarboxylic transport membrane protein
MKFNDAIIGAAVLLLAAVMVGMAQGFHTPPGQKFGPGFFPTIVGAIMGVSAVILILRGWLARRSVPWLTLDAWFSDRRLLLHGAAIFGALLVYLLASESVGFLVVAPLLLWGLIILYWGRPVAALAIALVASFVIHQFFVSVLLVPLPWGVVPYFKLF